MKCGFGQIASHVAAKITAEAVDYYGGIANHTMFVQELVNIITPDELAMQYKAGSTALCFAATSGIKKIAEVMVNKNKKLSSIRGSKGATTLCMAALLGHIQNGVVIGNLILTNT
ncbi:hypothetical protein Patl1_12361 [Pistacia atlantica]|uniref:Uncharacterized protein n=1 Tax=Pistacia atlantica TaxID=434234 RepID=A0ACC1A2X2_9ROSI|nr:hypothetical protein Patl1_12361 [Pistacia atlantica]